MTAMLSATLLDAIEDLERRDAGIADESSRVEELSDRVDAVRRRVAELDELLTRLPGEIASADGACADQQDRRVLARAELEAAAELTAELERRGRVGADERERALRKLVRAQEVVADVELSLDRASAARAALVARETSARAEVHAMAAEGDAVATRLAGLSRLSLSGRTRPEHGLGGLEAWAARAHAALVVVRAQLEMERDRLVREASELGSVVLGEQIAGNSVDLVGRRIRAALQG